MEKEKNQVEEIENDDDYLRVLPEPQLEKIESNISKKSSISKNKTPVYRNIKWSFGCLLILTGILVQLAVLPYADLVLISTNSISAIAFNTLLSVKCLGEKFVCKYDLPAFLFMGAGAITIVMLASTTEKVFNREMIVDILTSNRSLYFGAGTLITIALTIIFLEIFDDQVERFQQDLEFWTKN